MTNIEICILILLMPCIAVLGFAVIVIISASWSVVIYELHALFSQILDKIKYQFSLEKKTHDKFIKDKEALITFLELAVGEDNALGGELDPSKIPYYQVGINGIMETLIANKVILYKCNYTITANPKVENLEGVKRFKNNLDDLIRRLKG